MLTADILLNRICVKRRNIQIPKYILDRELFSFASCAGIESKTRSQASFKAYSALFQTCFSLLVALFQACFEWHAELLALSEIENPLLTNIPLSVYIEYIQ